MFRVCTSWRLLVASLCLAVLALAGAASSLERRQHERSIDLLVGQAQLMSELLFEVDLHPGDHREHEALAEDVQRRLDIRVQHLHRSSRLVGLQLWEVDGDLIYSDTTAADPLSDEELAELEEVFDEGPQVEFEHDAGRNSASATVLIEPRNSAGQRTGLVAEILLPQDQIAQELSAATRRLYLGAAVLVLVLVGSALAARRRILQREHQALHDPLTGLGNRTLLAQAAGTMLCQRARSRGKDHGGTVALMLLDLDGFKTVNDTLGHAVGDKLLIEVASTLQGCVRATDVVTRLGGDEFAVLLQDLPDAHSAVERARSISEVLHRPFGVDTVTLEVGASLGVALFGEHGDDLDALLRCADVAMYQAKRDGGGVRLYDEANDPHDSEQLGLLAQLRAAIEGDELLLHYQPKVALGGGRTVGMEALVRWQHPELGLLGPDRFVPLAERTALMRPLTTWVLREAVSQCAAWRADGWDVGVAVNIAPNTLLEAEFPALVVRLLAEVGLEGTALELEITETAVMIDPVRAAETLRVLQTMGVAVSIDDFGAGYTSLAYLKSLPVSSLKIDRGFITHLLQNSADEAVARSVVALGHDLGLTVVAEGVETGEVQQRLTELGCDQVQGYHLAKPMPGAATSAWLHARSAADASTPS